MPTIPEPELVGDTLVGSLLKLAGDIILALGTLPPTLPPAVVWRAQGELTIRYGLEYLQREAVIVPGLFAAEYGGMLVGREAWDYAMRHSNLHPRADILGLRSDGQEDQVMLRELDFGRPVAVLAYETPQARLPLARLAAYWLGAEPPRLPDLLETLLPCLKTLPTGNGLTD